MAEEKLDITNKIIIPGDGNLSSEETKKHIIKDLKDLTPEDMGMVATELDEEKERREREEIEKKEREKKDREREAKEKREKIEKIYWNKDAILDDLKENHIKVEEAEMMWYKWKIVEITLPEVWNFKRYSFKYFVSDDRIRKDEFESDPKLGNKSYEMEDVWGLLKAMNEYMKAMWVETDWNIDYENNLKFWEIWKKACKAWDCLKECLIDKAELDSWYRLMDTDVGWRKGSRVRWICCGNSCYCNRSDIDTNSANLFLRLS